MGYPGMANQRHQVRGLLIPLTRNFPIESHFSPASAGLFERGFISKGAPQYSAPKILQRGARSVGDVAYP